MSLFFCFYTSLSIIIYFRFVGRPGRYVYVFEGYRMEEVSTYEIQIAYKILCTKKYMYSAQWTTDNGKNRKHMLKQEVKSSTWIGKTQGFQLRQLCILSFSSFDYFMVF